MIRSTGTFCGRDAALVCDGKCAKAWGVNVRPKRSLSSDPDDYEFLSDGELGKAPLDPGTYEGGDAKPRRPIHNRWCWRECERSRMGSPGERLTIPKFDVPLANMESYAAVKMRPRCGRREHEPR